MFIKDFAAWETLKVTSWFDFYRYLAVRFIHLKISLCIDEYWDKLPWHFSTLVDWTLSKRSWKKIPRFYDAYGMSSNWRCQRKWDNCFFSNGRKSWQIFWLFRSSGCFNFRLLQSSYFQNMFVFRPLEKTLIWFGCGLICTNLVQVYIRM